MRYDKQIRKIAAVETALEEHKARAESAERELEKVRLALDSTLHEVRRLSAEISSNAEQLNKRILANHSSDAMLAELGSTIFYMAGMVSSRLAFTDLEMNPQAVEMQTPVRAGIYKKFEKAVHILGLKARQRKLSIKVSGQSYKEIEALPAFELLPFVILDNAIKYSPVGHDINIVFHERGNDLRVEISNLGPQLSSGEEASIFDRGARGLNAKKTPTGGAGLGLYLAQFLANYHDVQISADSDAPVSVSISNVPYSKFRITLQV